MTNDLKLFHLHLAPSSAPSSTFKDAKITFSNADIDLQYISKPEMQIPLKEFCGYDSNFAHRESSHLWLRAREYTVWFNSVGGLEGISQDDASAMLVYLYYYILNPLRVKTFNSALKPW